MNKFLTPLEPHEWEMSYDEYGSMVLTNVETNEIWSGTVYTEDGTLFYILKGCAVTFSLFHVVVGLTEEEIIAWKLTHDV